MSNEAVLLAQTICTSASHARREGIGPTLSGGLLPLPELTTFSPPIHTFQAARRRAVRRHSCGIMVQQALLKVATSSMTIIHAAGWVAKALANINGTLRL